MKYLTADLHFSHKKVTEYTDRKLVTTQQDHDEWLSEIISSSLKPGDELWILGDVVFKSTAWECLRPLANKGVFINVIKGNHDSTCEETPSIPLTLELASNKSKLYNTEREGVVYKCNEKPANFKAIFNNYLLKQK